MSEAFDIYTLLFLVLAVVIFIRLRNVLGRRTGNERPPYDPYAAPDAKRPRPDANEPVVVPLIHTWLQPGVRVARSRNRLNGFSITALRYTWLKPGENERSQVRTSGQARQCH